MLVGMLHRFCVRARAEHARRKQEVVEVSSIFLKINSQCAAKGMAIAAHVVSILVLVAVPSLGFDCPDCIQGVVMGGADVVDFFSGAKLTPLTYTQPHKCTPHCCVF